MVQGLILRAMSWIVFFLLALGSFLFATYPRISVESGQSLDPYKPFSTRFLIKNDGYWPIRKINYSLTLIDALCTDKRRFNDVTLAVIPPDAIPKLGPNEQSTIVLSGSDLLELSGCDVDNAEIYISLKYRAFLIPNIFTEDHRFKTEKKSSGEYIWSKLYSPI